MFEFLVIILLAVIALNSLPRWTQKKAPSTKITYDNSYHHSDEINFRKVDETWDAKLPRNPEFSPFDNR